MSGFDVLVSSDLSRFSSGIRPGCWERNEGRHTKELLTQFRRRKSSSTHMGVPSANWLVAMKEGDMPFIPEEPMERIEAGIDDLKEAVQAQTQAILRLNERIKVTNELLVKVHDAVTQPAEGDGLGDLLKQLVEADRQHMAVLQQVLAAVRPR